MLGRDYLVCPLYLDFGCVVELGVADPQEAGVLKWTPSILVL